jgi:imidazolonepropionase-like amidohydrolase
MLGDAQIAAAVEQARANVTPKKAHAYRQQLKAAAAKK